ncbi:hypothetical protein GJ744_004304 [Endocarpon pusillum]|uniref:N-acetyltransferase domain-containing protein n=1 Tax=Endocarpon pusillum TaxID=364733 RepID=A0A8H7DYW3_9EURO|nr:hypothetical protein GJ744_004304 [Endocarpon pusillum]
MSCTIRHATEEDVPTILDLIRELADYEKCLHEVLATTDSLRSTLSFPSTTSPTGWTPGYAKTLLITPSPSSSFSSSSSSEPANNSSSVTVAGMALYFHNYSTWTSAPGIYLEDLFVRPEFRGKGYGKALLAELASECLRLGCKRMDWSVLKWNQPSIDFYLSDVVGGKVMEEWSVVRVEGERLERLAGRGGERSREQS